MATPLVSVSMVTYNHGKYVSEAIRSVLGQTFRDLELVVVNDGSTDATGARIAEFNDPRLVVIHQDNQGPSAATNRALSACRGTYVALFSGDDVCHPNRIQRQVEEYARGPRGVLFADCDFIDDDGRPLTDGHFAETIFDTTARSRGQTLARLFHRGNYFNGITAFTEREIILEAPYDPGLLQLQDYDVWARLAKRYDLRIMPGSVISYRIRGGGGNLSSPTPDRLVRLQNETYLILRRFFDGVSPDLFREAFGDELIHLDFGDGLEYACEQAMLFCRASTPLGRLIGVERIHALLNDSAGADVLARRYGFTNQRFFDLLRAVNVGESYSGDVSTLFFDTGAGWNTTDRVTQRVLGAARDFRLSFDLPPGIRAGAFRWDPVELRTCRVRVTEIEITDCTGHTRLVDRDTLTTNGEAQPDGTIAFRLADPVFCWPAAGDEVRVSVRGEWEFDDALTTILAQSQRVHELTHQVLELRREVAAVYRSPSWRLTKPLRLARAAARRLKAG
jgi:glycosyltransferase involved in cell wall biosynthesis